MHTMRTTITIPKDVLHATLKVSGKKYLSEAIVSTLKEYLAMHERLGFLEKLFSLKMPHSFKAIKKNRKKGAWSL